MQNSASSPLSTIESVVILISHSSSLCFAFVGGFHIFQSSFSQKFRKNKTLVPHPFNIVNPFSTPWPAYQTKSPFFPPISQIKPTFPTPPFSFTGKSQRRQALQTCAAALALLKKPRALSLSWQLGSTLFLIDLLARQQFLNSSKFRGSFGRSFSCSGKIERPNCGVFNGDEKGISGPCGCLTKNENFFSFYFLKCFQWLSLFLSVMVFKQLKLAQLHPPHSFHLPTQALTVRQRHIKD